VGVFTSVLPLHNVQENVMNESQEVSVVHHILSRY